MPYQKLREVSAEEADAFLRGEDIEDEHHHACSDPDCIVPRPAPHKRPPQPAPKSPTGDKN